MAAAFAAGPDPDQDKAAVADTRTYLQRLEKLGFAGVVLVARGEAPLYAEGFGLADRERGLAVRLRLYPSGERDFFTWDGGIRPPKLVHFEAGADGRLQLKLGATAALK